MANKILVQFEARGAKALRSAIDQLSVSQTRLNQGNKKAELLQKKLNAQLSKYARVGALSTKTTRIQTGAFATMRSQMLLASFAFGLVNASILKLGRAFGDQEEAENRLRHATGGSIASLKAYASQLQKTTRFGDEETLGAMTLVAAYTKDEQAIASLTKAAQDLATAKGMDLKTATDMLSKSVFSSTNSMQRYGIAISGAAGSSDRLNSALAAVSTQAGGAAAADVDTFNGALDQMNNAVGDAAEDIGEVLAPAIIATADAIKFLSENLNAKAIVTWGTAITTVAASVFIYEKAIKGANISTALFNKLTKKNVFLAGATIALAAFIDHMGWFGDVTKESKEKVKDLNDTLKEGQDLSKGFHDIKLITDYAMALIKEQEILDNLTAKRQEAEQGVLTPNVVAGLQAAFAGLQPTVVRTTKELDNSMTTIQGMISGFKTSTATLEELILLEDRYAQIQAVRISLQAQGIDLIAKETSLQNDLQVMNGDMNVFAAEKLNLDIERVAIQEKYSKGLINETQAGIALTEVVIKQAKVQKDLDKAKMASAEKTMQIGSKAAQAFAKDSAVAKGMMVAEMMVSAYKTALNTRALLSKTMPPPLPGLLAGIEFVAASKMAMDAAKFEQGGMIGGRRHSQGGTIIEAERGEFVMCRDAVESIGVDTLESMNAGGGGTSIVINNPIISSEFVESELPELISEAVRKGVDFGIS